MIKQKINRRRFRIKTSSSELLAKHFFDIVEKGDLRYLLKLKDYSKLPEYDQNLLLDSFDLIISEHEKDSGNISFTNKAISDNYVLKEHIKIEALKVAYLIMFVDPEFGKEKIRAFGVNVKNNSPKELKKIENTWKALETKLRIRNLKNKSKKKIGNQFYGILSVLKTEFNNIDENTLSLKEMDSHINYINKKNKKLKKEYGR